MENLISIELGKRRNDVGSSKVFIFNISERNMKLIIPHQDELHRIMSQVAESTNETDSLNFEADEKDGGLRTLGFSLGANYVDVPSPLKYIGFNIASRHGHFYFAAPVIATSESRFGGVSKAYNETFRETGGCEWMPVNSHGVGYIMDKNTKENIIAITSINFRNTSGRVISLGNYGSEPRKIESEEERFLDWLSLFENTLRCYVNAFYTANGKLRAWRSQTPLYLDCLA